MRTEKFPVKIVEKGVSALIRKPSKLKGGKITQYFIFEYILPRKRNRLGEGIIIRHPAIDCYETERTRNMLKIKKP
jgi:hypothetical protein